jgi:hypothetical protein
MGTDASRLQETRKITMIVMDEFRYGKLILSWDDPTPRAPNLLSSSSHQSLWQSCCTLQLQSNLLGHKYQAELTEIV